MLTANSFGGVGGFARPIPRDGGADQFRGVPIVGRLPTDGTRGPEEKGCGRKWPDAEGLEYRAVEHEMREILWFRTTVAARRSLSSTNPVEIRVEESAVPVAA